MVAKADFDLVLHHGLLDGSQIDMQVRYQQRVGELNDCAAGRNNDGIAGTMSGTPFSAVLTTTLGLGITPNGHQRASPRARRPAQSRVRWQGTGPQLQQQVDGWAADEGELLGRLLQGQLAGGNGLVTLTLTLALALALMGHVALGARFGAGGCAHNRLGGGHGCHLLTQLAQFVAQGGHVISNSDGLGAHGAALGVNGALALHAVILFAHGEDLEAHLVKVFAPLALVDLADLVHANDVGQVVAPVVCRPFEFGVELEELLHHSARCSLGAGRHAFLNQGLALVGGLGDARVVVLDLVQLLDVHPSPMRVVVVATQPVLEGGVGNVNHEDGKGVLVAGLNKLLLARLLSAAATFSSLSSLACWRCTAGWSLSSKRMVCIGSTSWSRNTGTGYPKGFRKPYQDNVTDMPI
eukprot:4989594-Pleurochrysis_carterae.AAC.1